MKSRNPEAAPKKATIHDVARIADVSIATVSRALNKPDHVNRDMYDRVMAAAAQLGYTTNSAGKALKIARTRTIGTLLPRLDDPIFSEIAHGVQEVLYANDYVGFLQTSGYNNSVIFDSVYRLLNRGAEGLLIFGRIDDPKLMEFLSINPVPVLQIYSYLEGHPLPSVGVDNDACMRKMVQMLLQFGHREIALISGPLRGNDRQQTRKKAYEDVMAANGLRATVEVAPPDYTINDGGQAFRRILDARPNVSAVMCAADLLASGVLLECRRLGIETPSQVSVTGFDEVRCAPLLYRPLTTLAIPAGDMGRHAARAMIANLEEGAKLTSTQFDASLILRESVGPAPRSDRAA